MFKQENLYYQVNESNIVKIKTGQIVADSCRPSHFLYGMFGLYGSEMMKKANFFRIHKSDLIVWQTIFESDNEYYDSYTWHEEIDNKKGEITRTRDIANNDISISNVEAENELTTKYLVFSRVYSNSYFMFHGIYQYEKSEIIDNKLVLTYKRISTTHEYKLPESVKNNKTITATSFNVDKKWLP